MMLKLGIDKQINKVTWNQTWRICFNSETIKNAISKYNVIFYIQKATEKKSQLYISPQLVWCGTHLDALTSSRNPNKILLYY